MPERNDKRYSKPWRSGRRRGKAFSRGEVLSLVIPYHWTFSSIEVLWNVSPAPAAGPAELCQGKGQLCAGPSPSELSGGRAEPAHGEDPAALSWSSAHLYSALPASLWQLVTVTLCARCQGTGKPGRMKPFGVLTQTLIKCPGWAFIPPLDPCLQLLNCSCFFQMCYFIMMPPGLDRRAIIIFIV